MMPYFNDDELVRLCRRHTAIIAEQIIAIDAGRSIASLDREWHEVRRRLEKIGPPQTETGRIAWKRAGLEELEPVSPDDNGIEWYLGTLAKLLEVT